MSTESGYSNDLSLGRWVPSSLNMPTAFGKATLMWKSILNSWGLVLIFNISECKNRRQLVLQAVCIFVNTYSWWKEKPWCDRLLKSCQTVMRYILAPIWASIFYPSEDHQTLLNASFSLQQCIRCILIQVHVLWLLLGNLTFISHSFSPSWNRFQAIIEADGTEGTAPRFCRKSFGVNAVIDSIGPHECCQVEWPCHPSELSFSQIELMSMCGNKWSDSISSSGNVALMNRTNFHQIKIHLHEA